MSERRQNLDDHLGRVLMLLRHFGPSNERPLRGLTKLAKLDFLLRYPVFTERLLVNRGLPWTFGTAPSESERLAVESRMIRFKYGPWDDRYYPILGALCGLGLVGVHRSGRSLQFSLSTAGSRLAAELAERPEWREVDERAHFLQRNFDLTGTQLKNVIYRELPDVVDRPLRAVI